MSSEKINCIRCKHYFVTWDAQRPYGCKLFGFKTWQIPSVAVHQTSGKPCQGFETKQQIVQKNR